MHVCLILLLAVFQSASEGPPLPYLDHGACPFECCTYRDWTAETALIAYTHYTGPDSRKLAFAIKPGERVAAITGVVVTSKADEVRTTKPTTVEVHAKWAVEKLSLRPGDRLFLLTPQGEGFMSGWARGRLLESLDAGIFAEPKDCDSNPRCTGIIEKRGTRQWWAKVRNSRGRIGWVLMPRDRRVFANTDACG